MAIDTAADQAGPVTVRMGWLRGAELLRAAGIESARLDVEVLLRHLLGIEKEQLYVNADAPLTAAQEAKLGELLLRRARREPVAYITGKKEFWSLDLLVTPDVLIPRPETERLVDVCLQLVKFFDARSQQPVRILEMGTGSGAAAIALAKELPKAEIAATDVSAAALAVARENTRRHGLSNRIEFSQGSLFEAFAEGADRFDFIVSNPPYVRTGERGTLCPEIRDWEPVLALDGGKDGLDYYRRTSARAHRYLANGGYVVLEIGADMAGNVARLFAETNRYMPASIYQDDAGRDRVFAARMSSADSSRQV